MNKVNIATKNNLFSDKFFTLTFGTLGSYILPIVFLPILTRIYNPDEFSLYVIYITIVQIVSIFSTFKFELAIPLINNHYDRICLLRVSIINMLIISTLVGFLFFFYYTFVNNFPLLLVYLIPSGIIIHCLFTQILYNWLLANKKLKHISMGKIVFGILSSSFPIIIFFLFNLKDYSYIILSHQISLLIVSLIILITIYGSSIIRIFLSIFSIRFNEITYTFKKYKKYAIFSSPSSLMNMFGVWIPVLFIWIFFQEKYISLFFLSHRAVTFPLQVLGDSIGKIFYSEAFDNLKEGILNRSISKYFTLLFHIAYPFLIICIFLAPDLFKIIFSSDWAEAGFFVQIFAPLFFIRLLASPISTIPTILYKQEVEFKFQLILFLVRLATLIIGSFTKNLYLTLMLFSICSSFCWIIYLFIILKMGNVKIYPLLTDLRKNKLQYLLILISTLSINFLIMDPIYLSISLLLLILYCLYNLLLEIKKI